MCLRSQGIDNNDDGDVGEERWCRGLSDDNGGIGRGQGIYNMSKGLETTTEVAGVRQRPKEIYDNDGGVDEGR